MTREEGQCGDFSSCIHPCLALPVDMLQSSLVSQLACQSWLWPSWPTADPLLRELSQISWLASVKLTGAAGKELCNGDENSWLFSSNPLVFFRIFQPQFSQEESFSTTYSLLFAGRVLLLSQVLVSFQMPSLLLRTWQAVPVKLTGQQDLPATVFPTLPLLKNLPNLQKSFLPHTPVLPTLQSSFFNTAFPSTSTEL